MFTRCPQCKTVHPLSAASVSHARGLVQCGQCGRIFSSLSFLFDEWPSGQAYSPAKGSGVGPPVLGSAPNTDKKTDSTAPEADDAGESDAKPKRLAWGIAATLLVLLTIANAAWKNLSDQPGFYATYAKTYTERLAKMGVVVQDAPNGDTHYIVVPNSWTVVKEAAGEDDESEDEGEAVANPLEEIMKTARIVGANVITENILDAFLDY